MLSEAKADTKGQGWERMESLINIVSVGVMKIFLEIDK